MARFGPRVLIHAGTRIDLVANTVRANGVEAALTPLEADLLGYLARADRVVTADELLREVWGYNAQAQSHTVKTTVARLRRKIERDPAMPELVVTVHTLGYRWSGSAPPPSAPHVDGFVGRAAELVELAGLAGRAGARLITVIGEGGIGKTRLARQFLAQRPHLDVALADCRTREDVGAALAGRLGLPLVPELPELGAELVKRRRAWVLLDNLEQLDSGGREMVLELIRICPSVQFLGTSRARLGHPAETAMLLQPLLPKDARDLFLSRCAQRAVVHSDPDLPALVESLEGRPLDLELAAARLGPLSVSRLLQRLHRPLDVLARPEQPGRQASARASIAWSWELCTPGERADLLDLRVFESPFTFEAAEAVLGDTALDRLQRLSDRSWVRATPDDRLWIVQATRQFLDEAGGPSERARIAHLSWFAAFADPQWRARLDEGNGAPRRALNAEFPDLLAATRYGLASARWEEGALALVGAFCGAEAGLPRNPLLALVPMFEGRISEAIHAELLAEVGDAYGAIDAVELSLETTARALDLARTHGRWLAFARASLRRAGPLWVRGDKEGARALLLETLEMLKAVDAPALHAMTWAKLSGLTFFFGEFQASEHAARMTRAAAERCASVRMTASAELAEGRAAMSLGRVEVALDALSAARRDFERAGLPVGGAIAGAQRAIVLRCVGRCDEALVELDAAERRTTSRPQLLLTLHAQRAEVLRRAGDLAGARTALARIHAAPGGFDAIPHSDRDEIQAIRSELEEPPEVALRQLGAQMESASARQHEFGRLQVLGRVVRVLVAAGRREEARAALEELERGRIAGGWGAAGNEIAEGVMEGRALLGETATAPPSVG